MESPPGLETRSRKRKHSPEVEQIGIDIQEIVEKTPGASAAKWLQGPTKNTAPKPGKKVVPAPIRSPSPHVPVAGPEVCADATIAHGGLMVADGKKRGSPETHTYKQISDHTPVCLHRDIDSNHKPHPLLVSACGGRKKPFLFGQIMISERQNIHSAEDSSAASRQINGTWLLGDVHRISVVVWLP
ncbi:hypothetical protein GGX14DRAFT_399865 [Mycena pura]|uniref:Uncharacterized protein n=1 Tax=Mycena pura TaxID=153505 RepID=A0AAD6V3T1_9AGAR|nr:hypothetical protein GGX14DRAFT_399865 [Mycena pura]